MKRKILLVGLLTVLCLMMTGLMTGCGNTDNDELALAVVGSPHSNEPGFPLNAVSMKDKLYDCCYTYGSVSFITCDGDPKVVYQASIPAPEKSGLSEDKKRAIANGYTNQLLAELSKVHSEVPEVDTLKAISCAAKTLLDADAEADRVLVVMDSGLSTTGYLDFTKDVLDADTDEIVKKLSMKEAIPDLSGVNVEWMFLGQTALPQPELAEKQKHKLEDVWRAILLAGGAKNVEFVNDIASDEPARTLPAVSLVDVQEREIDVVVTKDNSEEVVIEKPMETIVLDNTAVRFIGDTANFVDYDEASAVLMQYAQLLLEHPNNKVYVVGTTATGSREFCEELSVKRANAVCQVLISHGVPDTQLTPIGMGYSDPWHVEDLDEAGRQIEEYASQNRKVLIIDVNSEDAKKME